MQKIKENKLENTKYEKQKRDFKKIISKYSTSQDIK